MRSFIAIVRKKYSRGQALNLDILIAEPYSMIILRFDTYSGSASPCFKISRVTFSSICYLLWLQFSVDTIHLVVVNMHVHIDSVSVIDYKVSIYSMKQFKILGAVGDSVKKTSDFLQDIMRQFLEEKSIIYIVNYHNCNF